MLQFVLLVQQRLLAGSGIRRAGFADGTGACALPGRWWWRGSACGGAVGAPVVAGPGSRPGRGRPAVRAGKPHRNRNRGDAVRQPSPGHRGPAGRRDPPAGPSQELPGRPRHSSRAGPCRRDGDRGGPGARRVHSTAARWLAEAGLLGADPKANTGQLVELYVHRRLTTREVAAELGISKGRVIQALAAAGIPRRPRSVRRPRGARAAVTDTALAEVYHRQGMTIAQAATHFGVSEEYLRRRVAEAGLTRRPGTFAPRSAWSPEVLQAKAAKLYETGMTMREAGARLGVSSSTVSMVLHAAKVPVRPGGGTR